MKGNRIVPVFLSALMLSGVALCACSTQKNTETSSKIEVTTAAQTVTEQITIRDDVSGKSKPNKI